MPPQSETITHCAGCGKPCTEDDLEFMSFQVFIFCSDCIKKDTCGGRMTRHDAKLKLHTCWSKSIYYPYKLSWISDDYSVWVDACDEMMMNPIYDQWFDFVTAQRNEPSRQ